MVILFQSLFNSVIERKSVVETVNIDGGRFIREAKVSILIEGLIKIISRQSFSFWTVFHWLSLFAAAQ